MRSRARIRVYMNTKEDRFRVRTMLVKHLPHTSPYLFLVDDDWPGEPQRRSWLLFLDLDTEEEVQAAQEAGEEAGFTPETVYAALRTLWKENNEQSDLPIRSITYRDGHGSHEWPEW